MNPVRVAAFLAIAPCAALASVACGSEDVLIGIQDGQDASSSSNDAGGLGPWTYDAAEFPDADLGPCLPDAGCPSGSSCVFPVDASCGAVGECLAGGIQNPVGPNVIVVCGVSAPCSGGRTLTTTAPACDGGAASGQDRVDGATNSGGH